MILCVWRQSLRFGNRIHRLKPTECCNTVCCPTKTNRQQSFSVVQLQERMQARNVIFSREWFAIHHHHCNQRSGRIYARPRCTGSRKCISSALLDELFQPHSLLFPRMTNGRGGVSLSSVGESQRRKTSIFGDILSGWLSDLPTSNHSQVSTTGGTLMSQKAESSGTTRPITSFTL